MGDSVPNTQVVLLGNRKDPVELDTALSIHGVHKLSLGGVHVGSVKPPTMCLKRMNLHPGLSVTGRGVIF